jgi:hypothetical protein
LQLVKKFTAFYGTRRFLTALASALHDDRATSVLKATAYTLGDERSILGRGKTFLSVTKANRL